MKQNNHPEFNFEASVIARDEALIRVDENADADWKDAAEACILYVAARVQSFTTDDIWMELMVRDVKPPHEHRAMGSVMRKLACQGMIKTIPGSFEKSIMTGCHRRPKQRWTKA